MFTGMLVLKYILTACVSGRHAKGRVERIVLTREYPAGRSVNMQALWRTQNPVMMIQRSQCIEDTGLQVLHLPAQISNLKKMAYRKEEKLYYIRLILQRYVKMAI